jgi:membrane-bound inhibitor of C-type lysozyme
MKNALLVVGIGAIILGAGWWYMARSGNDVTEIREEVQTTPQAKQEASPDPKESQGAAIGDENLVTFQCDGGKSVTAVFERDIVGLTLSDGRQLVLRQAVGGSGIRYLSNDTTIEFRGKGNEGSLIENSATTYSNCTATN